MINSAQFRTGARILVATVTVATTAGVGWAAFNEHMPNACVASAQPVREARANALRAVEVASDADDDSRDAAAMALQRWQATLERATRACGLSA